MSKPVGTPPINIWSEIVRPARVHLLIIQAQRSYKKNIVKLLSPCPCKNDCTIIIKGLVLFRHFYSIMWTAVDVINNMHTGYLDYDCVQMLTRYIVRSC